MNEPRREQLSDDVTLWLGDMRDLVGNLGQFDAIVTDPPYGIGIAANPVRQAHEKMDWDCERPGDGIIGYLLTVSREQIIWGGNYFDLPPSRGFLIWDKKQPESFSLAMCEMAWCSRDMNAKVFTLSVTNYAKEHPTQKPVQLMEWCLRFVPDCNLICDPFMGAGTTGVACVNEGRSFIGIEREPRYFDIARRRVSEALKRPRLPLPEPQHAPKQEAFL